MEEVVQQQMQSAAEQDSGTPRPPANVVLNRDEVLIRADEQEKIQDIYKVRGNVEIRFRNNTIHCDQATYDSTTGQITATGHVVYDGGTHNEHLVGTHATYDVSRDTGTFYDVTGSTGIKVKNQMMFLTSSTPFFFTGKVVDKLGPDLYRVHQGIVTSCQLPKPKWEFHPGDRYRGGRRRRQDVSLHLAHQGNPGLLLSLRAASRRQSRAQERIPDSRDRAVEYQRERSSAIPSTGRSTATPTPRSAATISPRAAGRKSATTATSAGTTSFTPSTTESSTSRAILYTKQNQGGEEIKVNGAAALPYGFRGVVSVDYLSSYVFRLAFGQSFTEAINSEVRSAGFVSKSWSGNFLGLLDVALPELPEHGPRRRDRHRPHPQLSDGRRREPDLRLEVHVHL